MANREPELIDRFNYRGHDVAIYEVQTDAWCHECGLFVEPDEKFCLICKREYAPTNRFQAFIDGASTDITSEDLAGCTEAAKYAIDVFMEESANDANDALGSDLTQPSNIIDNPQRLAELAEQAMKGSLGLRLEMLLGSDSTEQMDKRGMLAEQAMKGGLGTMLLSYVSGNFQQQSPRLPPRS